MTSLPPLAMHTPDERWTVKEFVSRGRQMYLVTERTTVGSVTSRLGRVVGSLELVAIMLGSAFDALVTD